MKKHIHILGASGSGTTTIGKIVAERFGYAHFDSDNFYWQPTDNPFTVRRELNECLTLLRDNINQHNKWILSGSVMDWGNELIPQFDLVVFVYLPTDVRIERLKKREYERYGDEMLPGRNKYEKVKEFIEWAASYDTGTDYGRNLIRHEEWLKRVECTLIRIGNDNLDDSINNVINAINESPA